MANLQGQADMTDRKRNSRSYAAEAKFRRRLADLGAELLEPEWLGAHTPHRVRCRAGHPCRPRPNSVVQGQGICRICAERDPATAATKFRVLLAERGATLLEPVWLGTGTPHRILCAVGHECQPRPNAVFKGQGICRVCARRDPATAEAAFRAALENLGAVLLEPYKGAPATHHVRCARDHDCYPTPQHVSRGLGICRVCAGQDPATAEAAFRAALAALGATLLEPYKNALMSHRVLCAAGHECRPSPHNVTRGHGVCPACMGKTWDVFYVVTHKAEPRVKFGISSLDGRARLEVHRSAGYTEIVRLVTGLPECLAQDTENAVRAALADAGAKPLQGREYFDLSCLGLIVDVADAWLSGTGNAAA